MSAAMEVRYGAEVGGDFASSVQMFVFKAEAANGEIIIF